MTLFVVSKSDRSVSEFGKIGSEPSFEYVKKGVELALKNRIHALVTAPISKKKWLDVGIPFEGHTEFLATVSEAENHVMFFWSEKLKVALFTTHIPLKDVFSFTIDLNDSNKELKVE